MRQLGPFDLVAGGQLAAAERGLAVEREPLGESAGHRRTARVAVERSLDALEIAIEPEPGGEVGLGQRQRPVPAVELAQPQRAGESRPLGVDADSAVKRRPARLAFAERQLGRGCRQAAFEAAAQVAAALGLEADRAVVAFEQRAAVDQRQPHVGKLERLFGPLGKQQRVERAEAQLAAIERAVETRPDQPHAGDPGIAEAIADDDFGALHRQVRPRRIADDDVGQDLPPPADPLDLVSRRNAVGFERRADHVVGDVLALHPQGEDHEREDQQERKDDPAAPERTWPSRYRFRSVDSIVLRHCPHTCARPALKAMRTFAA